MLSTVRYGNAVALRLSPTYRSRQPTSEGEGEGGWTVFFAVGPREGLVRVVSEKYVVDEVAASGGS